MGNTIGKVDFLESLVDVEEWCEVSNEVIAATCFAALKVCIMVDVVVVGSMVLPRLAY